jgi:purine catabolism regulator
VEFASVFQHVPQEVMQAYCDRILHALTARDEAYAGDMLKTLEAYIRHDGQVHKVAKSLHIHRNTVAYRLEKAGEILNMDLNRLEDMMKLKVVFLFRRLIEKDKTG